MAVANFGFDAFDFFPPQGEDTPMSLKWCLPADRIKTNRSAVACIHQFLEVAEESDESIAFSYYSGTKDITDWTITAYLAVHPGTADPVATVSGEITSEANGAYTVTIPFKASEDVPVGEYLLSVYRTDTDHQLLLANIRVDVFNTGIPASS